MLSSDDLLIKGGLIHACVVRIGLKIIFNAADNDYNNSSPAFLCSPLVCELDTCIFICCIFSVISGPLCSNEKLVRYSIFVIRHSFFRS